MRKHNNIKKVGQKTLINETVKQLKVQFNVSTKLEKIDYVIHVANTSAQKHYKSKRNTRELSYGLLPEVY